MKTLEDKIKTLEQKSLIAQTLEDKIKTIEYHVFKDKAGEEEDWEIIGIWYEEEDWRTKITGAQK